MDELKEMRKLLEEIDSDLKDISAKTEIVAEARHKQENGRAKKREPSGRLESVIREECADIKRMIREIDNQTIADSVSKMVVDQMMAPLKEAISSAVSGKSESRSIGMIAEDMKRKVERLSDRHIRVIKCLSQANGEWVNYDYLSGVCQISQSCMRGYISDLRKVYEIPLETSSLGGKTHVRMDPQTIKKLALGYQASKIKAA